MIPVAPLRRGENRRSILAEVAIAAPQRCYEVVSDAERLWILPEPWKTPGSPEIDRRVTLAFPTAPWTALRTAAQAPQGSTSTALSRGESDVRFTTLKR